MFLLIDMYGQEFYGGLLFSSPLFGDMFLLPGMVEPIENGERFSSPLFGDMFLLQKAVMHTKWTQFSSPLFGDMFLLLFNQLVNISTIIDIFYGTLNGQ